MDENSHEQSHVYKTQLCIMFDKLWCRKFYVRFIKKKTKKPANQPTFENGGRSTSKIFFIYEQCSHSR